MTTSDVDKTGSAQSIYDALNVRQTSAASQTEEMQNRFLTLLTAQLRNQDPLNPMDNNQMTSQLAQISALDGIERLNASLQALLDSSAGTQAMQAAALVNHTVLVPGNSLMLGEQGGVGGLELALPADEVVVTINDANGLVLRTLNLGALDAGIHPFAWDGMTDGGEQAVSGTYSYSIVAKRGTETVAANALAYGVVQAVTRGAGGLTLYIGTLGAFALTDVKQIL